MSRRWPLLLAPPGAPFPPLAAAGASPEKPARLDNWFPPTRTEHLPRCSRPNICCRGALSPLILFFYQRALQQGRSTIGKVNSRHAAGQTHGLGAPGILPLSSRMVSITTRNLGSGNKKGQICSGSLGFWYDSSRKLFRFGVRCSERLVKSSAY